MAYHRAMSRWLVATFLSLALVVPHAARAQDNTEQARTLFANGKRLFKEGLYDDAIAAWKEGYRLSSKPLFLYNIALGYERMAFLVEALEYMNRYRAFAPAREADQLTVRVAEIEHRILEIEAGRPDPGHKTSGGSDAAFEDLPNEPVDLEPVGEDEEVPKIKLPVAPITFAAAGLGGIVAGSVLGAKAGGARKEAQGYCVEGDSSYCTYEADPLMSQSRGLAVASDISFIVGTGALAAGVYTFLFTGEGPSVYFGSNGQGPTVTVTVPLK